MQRRSLFRWIAAAAIALLVSYLRAAGYLPGSMQETAIEDQTETNLAEAENEQNADAEAHTDAESEQQESNILSRDEFCRTTYEVLVYSFCDSD